jgi:hypothetical protein
VTQRKPSPKQRALVDQRARSSRLDKRRQTRQRVIMLILVIAIAAMVLATV